MFVYLVESPWDKSYKSFKLKFKYKILEVLKMTKFYTHIVDH